MQFSPMTKQGSVLFVNPARGTPTIKKRYTVLIITKASPLFCILRRVEQVLVGRYSIGFYRELWSLPATATSLRELILTKHVKQYKII